MHLCPFDIGDPSMKERSTVRPASLPLGKETVKRLTLTRVQAGLRAGRPEHAYPSSMPYCNMSQYFCTQNTECHP
jgi:hypothetical protein